MRTLGINFQVAQEPSCAEAFLKFSPRVQFRYPHFVFCDIESTTGLFGSESRLLAEALNLARALVSANGTSQFPVHDVTAAIADSAYTAQVLTVYRPSLITTAGKDLESIKSLPLSSITEMEGLRPWPKKGSLEHVVSFFKTLGVEKIAEAVHLPQISFRERWADTGATLWDRVHQKEIQVISPLSTRDPLVAYAYFDAPVSWVPHIRQKLDPLLHGLFLRLEGLNRFAQKLHLSLICEYSDHKHSLFVEPISASRDEKLFLDLILQKLDDIDLDNPIRDFEIEIYDVPEKVQQLDFFEPRDLTEDRWKRLISFSQQADCEMGFLQVEASHFPEKSYHLKTDWPEDFSSKDVITMENSAIQVKTVYAKGLTKSPRPSLLLKNPLRMSQTMLDRLQMISRIPTERIDSAWWDFSKKEHKVRDYYFALSQDGQLLWIYQERRSRNYYLHGYFD